MAAELAAQLLAPWTGPPHFVAAPSDPKRAEVVKKLAQFVVKNGVNFLDLIKTKQQQNPEYTFLFGGEDSDYYSWILFATIYGLPLEQPPPSDFRAVAMVVIMAPTRLQESIKQSQQWFLACTPFASGMAAKMAQQVRQLSDHTRQLHVLYMANDILLKSWELLMPLQVAGQLRKMLQFWGERKVYDRDTLQQLEAAVQSRDRDAQLQPPKPPFPAPQMPQAGFPGGHVLQQPSSPWPRQTPTAAVATQHPECAGTKISDRSSRGGLQDKLTTDPPYSPLSPLDIERAGIPEMKGELDDYLKSRLDQLYAELRDWRPGTIRADDPDERRSARRKEHAGHFGSRGDDGSVDTGGGKGSNFTGLGFSRQPEKKAAAPHLSDDFNSFRHQRSGVYHDMILRSVGQK
eukprot:jgi/Astpho2/2324/e_gw1.00043.8.1_t